MATLIRTDGTTEKVFPHDTSEGFRLAQLYAMLSCSMIEVIHLGDGFIMVIDEEGKLVAEPTLNPQATFWARDIAGAIAKDDCIVGHALVCLDSEVK